MARGNDERHNPNRRPSIAWRTDDGKSVQGPELGNFISNSMKDQVYNSIFNDIVGLSNDFVIRDGKDVDNG